MVTLTDKAKEMMLYVLQKEKNPDTAVRLQPSEEVDGKLVLIFDKQRLGDQVVEGQSGEKILLIQSDLAARLDEMVIDYKESGEQTGFVISAV
jgi:Fe-S cluster assembly iron-binding protein IscA